jgi:autophagy-related protein 2
VRKYPKGISPTHAHALTGSLDEAAFSKPPEIGPAPDMIYDDLPTNLDYLDESFGAAAGLRELTDDDFDEFDTTEIDARNVSVSESSTGIISSVGGETIKLLEEDGINIIEDYYDTLPREVVEDRPE